jgi:bifunctional non-homologous end joining protein LigD
MIHRLLELDGHTLMVSDPDRRLFDDGGPTKADLLAYYLKVAPGLVPFLAGRAVSTVLLPDASTQEFRFARAVPRGCPGRFPSHGLIGAGGSQRERYLTVPDGGVLAALVDWGCLSFHPWNSTVSAPHAPTQMVFNLDPEAIAFREVRNAACLLRDLLATFGLKAWVKTSGGHGLHVLVPLSGAASFDQTRVVAETIARRAIRRDPTLFSRDPRRGKRRGRILIDTSRNQRGETLIAPYAVATSGHVSTLLEWDELSRPTYPEDFTMSTVLARTRADARNRAAFFDAAQTLDRWLPRRPGSQSAPRGTSWIPGDTPAAVHSQAQWLGGESQRLRDEAEVTRAQNTDIRHRAQKVCDEARRSDKRSA